MSDEVLIHYGKAHNENPPGRGSGRYAWGSGKKSILSKFFKKRTDKATNEAQKKENIKVALDELKKKDSKKYEEALRNRLDELKKNDPKEYEKYRKRALNYGGATEISMFKGDISNEEYRNAIDRITFERRIDSLKEEEKVTATKIIDNTMKNINKVNNWTSTAIKTYQNYEAVRKAMDSKVKEVEKKKRG